jgi:hypothetical protein
MEAGTAMSHLALDLSLSTGWALWWPGDVTSLFKRPDWTEIFHLLDLHEKTKNWHYFGHNGGSVAYGRWQLPPMKANRGSRCNALQDRLAFLWERVEFEYLHFEDGINLHGGVSTSADNIKLTLELETAVCSFGDRFGMRSTDATKPDKWRVPFIGRDYDSEVRKAASRAGKPPRDRLKAATAERCRQLGFLPRNYDEADAIGLLTYGMLSKGDQPLWLDSETLRPPMAGAAA